MLDEPNQCSEIQVAVLEARQAVEGERGADVLLDPVGELGVFLLPAGEPGGEIALCLGEIAGPEATLLQF